MSNVISFSLWGNNPKYCIGAIKNAQLAKEIYPDWICRFYVGKDIPNEILSELKSFDNTEVFIMNEPPNWTGMFWRFYAMFDPSIDILISRDTDSRLSTREKLAVDEWIDSGSPFHIMRDHSWHNTQILGGMWGCLPKCIDKSLLQTILSFDKKDQYDTDQAWLRQIVWPLVKDIAFVHDEIHKIRLFPAPRVNGEYVGAPFNENDELEIEFK